MNTLSELNCNDDSGNLVIALMKELASELDLHYENHDATGLVAPLSHLRSGVAFLKTKALPIPGVVSHVLQRFPAALAE